MATGTVRTGSRITPAELTPEQRAKYEVLKAKAIADRHLEGPPLPPIDRNDDPFVVVLSTCISQLKQAREAAGLTLAQVAEKTGLAAETLCRLETGAVTNPTFRTLGLYAVAVGRKLTLAAIPL